MLKKFILCIFFTFMICCPISLLAHNNILDIDFEECKFLTDSMDDNDIMWYSLDTYNNVVHIDDDIYTIKYYFSDTAKDDPSYTWMTNFTEEKVELVKNSYIESMKKWNDVYYYTYDEYGNRVSNKIINVIEGTEEDNNLVIYPRKIMGSNDNVVASVNTFPTNDNLIDQRITNNTILNHYHKSNYEMILNKEFYYDLCFDSFSNAKNITGMHELGHILGLFDLDIECNCEPQTHIYSIMGYGSKLENISYYDIAGVSITRGFHTDEDHIWMKRINEDETIDLICSLCNGILYDVDIPYNSNSYNNKTLNAYQSCVHYGGSNFDMVLVGTNGIQDFYKCQYCRHVETITYYEEKSTNNNTINSTIDLEKNEVQYVKFNVQSNNEFIFHIESDEKIEYELYDSSLNKIQGIVGNKSRYLFTQFLTAGTYYLKTKFSQSNMYGEIFIHILSNTISNGIIVDPSSADYCGTQISMVEKDLTNKSYRETFITKGFTRHIYLDTLYAPSDSRRSYYWYSSNDNILEVTEYGTVLGKSVGSAKIFGVYKNNPSIVFVKEFTVINNLDETTIELEFSQTYTLGSNDPCKLALNSSNSPFPKNQYYEFTFIENNIGASIDQYGIVKVDEVGDLEIRCRYLLNTKYVLIVKLKVID